MSTDEYNEKQIQVTWYNFLTIEWLTPLMLKGARAPLQSNDLLQLQPKDKATNLSKILDPFWSETLKGANPSLFKNLFQHFYFLFFVAVICQGISISCVLLLP